MVQPYVRVCAMLEDTWDVEANLPKGEVAALPE